MGFTPLEGLVMLTRSGDIDPGVVLELSKLFSVQEADEILNYQSGLKGVCGLSDMKEILAEAKQGNKQAKLALQIFIYRIQKYIGAYSAILGGCDILVFTGAIGVGSKKIRNMVCNSLNILKSPKPTKILAIKTDEELAIAQKIKRLCIIKKDSH
ncbi:Acetate kinase [subsurface metagenome]